MKSREQLKKGTKAKRGKKGEGEFDELWEIELAIAKKNAK